MLCWTARTVALFVAGMFLFLIAGEMFSLGRPPTHLNEWTGLGLVGVTLAGMLAAWKWEMPGALVSLTALAGFVWIQQMHRYGVVAVLAAPGLLFLADSILKRGHPAR